MCSKLDKFNSGKKNYNDALLCYAKSKKFIKRVFSKWPWVREAVWTVDWAATHPSIQIEPRRARQPWTAAARQATGAGAPTAAEAGEDADADAAAVVPPHHRLPPPPPRQRSTPPRPRPFLSTRPRRSWAPAPTCAQVTLCLLTSAQRRWNQPVCVPVAPARTTCSPKLRKQGGPVGSVNQLVVLELMSAMIFRCSEGTSAERAAEGPGRAWAGGRRPRAHVSFPRRQEGEPSIHSWLNPFAIGPASIHADV